MAQKSYCIIGGGFSGICAAIKLLTELNQWNFKIFERNSNFGGTWLVNTYPGCGCDVKSTLYSYSFEPNPDWSRSYSGQEEILDYLKRVAKKYNLYSRAEFNSQVHALDWDDENGHWAVTVLNSGTLKKYIFDFVFFGVGLLQTPNSPDIFQNFKGVKLHSAEWDQSVDLMGKRIGIVGSGASAIQIIPEIAKSASQVHSFQRSPAHILPKSNGQIPTFFKSLYSFFGIFQLIERSINFLINECIFFFFRNFFGWINLNFILELISLIYLKCGTWGDSELTSKLKPVTKIGCKRILLSSDYLQAFRRKNVILHRGRIDEVKGSTIKIKGEDTPIELDILILATGFKTQEFFHPMRIRGRYGIDLKKYWESGPKTYYGILCDILPNAFILYGPNTNLGNNSIIFQIECQMRMAIDILREMFKRGAKTVSIQEKVQAQWMDQIDKDMGKTIWGSCNSWYRDSNGKNNINWPKTCISYWYETKNVKMTGMEFTHLILDQSGKIKQGF